MKDKFPIVSFFGLRFNLAIDISVLITCVIVFCLSIYFTRNLKMKPSKKQNMIEWLIDFTNGIVDSSIYSSDSNNFYMFSFVLFCFVFIANQLGLLVELIINGYTWIDSPTANGVVTLGLALMVLLISHFYGVKKYGFLGYLKLYIKPMPVLLPINIIEEFTNFLTLGLRLYGNIFAGEVLLMLVAKLGMMLHAFSFLVIPIEVIWQGFSVFIGSIQAFIFVTLSMVYISAKINPE